MCCPTPTFTRPGLQLFRLAGRQQLLMLRAGTAATSSRRLYTRGRCRADIGGDYTARTSPTAIRWSVDRGTFHDPGAGRQVGPPIQGIDDLIAKDPNAHWDDTNKRVVSTKKPEPARVPDSALRSGVLRGGQGERPRRRPQGGRTGSASSSRTQRRQSLRPHHTCHPGMIDEAAGPGAQRHVSRKSSGWWSNMARLVWFHPHRRRRSRRRSDALLRRRRRAGRSPTSGPARARLPDIVIVDGRGDLDEGDGQTIERLARRHRGHLLRRRRDSSPDLILQAMRAGANEFFAWPPSRERFDEAPSAGRGAASTPRRSRRRPPSRSSAPRAAPARRRSR